MPAIGVSGVDLYSRSINGKWLWAAGKFSFGGYGHIQVLGS